MYVYMRLCVSRCAACLLCALRACLSCVARAFVSSVPRWMVCIRRASARLHNFCVACACVPRCLARLLRTPRACVSRRVSRLLCVFAWMVLVCTPAAYTLEEQVTIRALSLFHSMPISTWHWGGFAEATLDLRAERNPVVRGQLQIESTLFTGGIPVNSDLLSLVCSGSNAAGQLCIDVPRANIRVRIPVSDSTRIRFTLGRARLTWGQGQVFNAGDLLFGADPEQNNYTEDTIRDETALLFASFIPLTDFTFIEIVALPPVSILTDVPLEDGAAGLRLQGKAAQLKYEVGYLYNGDDSAHNIALSLQGNLGIDMYLSATTAVIHDSSDIVDELYRLLQITFGLYHAIDLENNLTLSLRLESLWRPSGVWQETDNADTRYALLLYPEVALSISNAVQLFLRALFSPIDLSAQFIGGVSWVPYSGLSLLFYPAISIGEMTDTYHIDQRGGLQFTVGAQYIF